MQIVIFQNFVDKCNFDQTIACQICITGCEVKIISKKANKKKLWSLILDKPNIEEWNKKNKLKMKKKGIPTKLSKSTKPRNLDYGNRIT